MGRSRWCLLLALVQCAAPYRPALAGTSPPGVNLRWDRCYADGGASNRDFACNTNDGQDQLVGSFELAQSLSQVVTEEFVVDMRSASGAWPAWWNVVNVGACRRPSFQLLNYPSGDPSSCDQWIQYPSGGGISMFAIGDQGPDHVRITAAVTSSGAPTLLPGHEYFGFRFTLDHAKTVGAGTCGGCNTPVCIFLSRVSLYQARATDAAIHLDQGANALASQYVTWQGGTPVNVQVACDPSVPDCTLRYTSFGCILAATAATHSTWGAVKSLYR